MKEKYYVKDILERFQITRDALKYYEKQGLVWGARDENGYRCYGFQDMKRIERVLWMLKLGYSIEQIRTYLSGRSFEEEMQMNAVRLRELEKELLLARERLRFARHMDAYQSEIPAHYRHWLICRDTVICPGCERATQLGGITQREMELLHLNGDLTVAHRESFDRMMAMEVVLYNDDCRHCDCERVIRGTFAQGIIKLADMGDLPRQLRAIRAEVERQGYTMERKVYCFYAYYVEAEPKEEGVAVNFFIPLLEKEGNT